MRARYIIQFHTEKPKAPEIYLDNSQEMVKLFERIVELTKKNAKFIIIFSDKCMGDFS